MLKLPTAELLSLLRNADVAATGTSLTYMLTHVVAVPLGESAPLVAMALTVVVGYFRKLITVPIPPTA